MMDLAQRLPDCVYVGRKRYKLRTEFYRVLQCFAIIRDASLLPEHQITLCLRILLRRWVLPFSIRKRSEILKTIMEEYISPQKKRPGQKSMDFQYDSPYIFAAFYQSYGIRLTDSKIHWWEFLALLGSLPDDTKMAQIVSIRTRPMPKPTKHNGEERARLARLKADWAVYKTDAERERDMQEGLKKMALAMEAMARR